MYLIHNFQCYYRIKIQLLTSTWTRSTFDLLLSFAFSQSLLYLSPVRSVVEQHCHVQEKQLDDMQHWMWLSLFARSFFLSKYRSAAKNFTIDNAYVTRNVAVMHTAPPQLNKVLWFEVPYSFIFSKIRTAFNPLPSAGSFISNNYVNDK